VIYPTIDALATADNFVAEIRLIPNSIHNLRDYVPRLRAFNATMHFSNMTGKWQATPDRRGSSLLTFTKQTPAN
jgi:hypothetical protein